MVLIIVLLHPNTSNLCQGTLFLQYEFRNNASKLQLFQLENRFSKLSTNNFLSGILESHLTRKRVEQRKKQSRQSFHYIHFWETQTTKRYREKQSTGIPNFTNSYTPYIKVMQILKKPRKTIHR